MGEELIFITWNVCLCTDIRRTAETARLLYKQIIFL
jgi:hypothetical protein